MKICIAGPGAMGIFLACTLSSRYEVSLLHYDPSVCIELSESGFLYSEGGEDKRYRIPVFCDIPADADVLIIAFKAYGYKSAEKYLGQGNPRCVVTIQNGLGNCEKLADYYPKDRIFAASVSYGVSRISRIEVELKGVGEIRLGSFFGRNPATVPARIFSSCGLNVETFENIKRQLWLKVGVNACINPLASLFNCVNGDLLANEDAQRSWVRIANEVSLASRTDGIQLSVDEILSAAKRVAGLTANNICSMLQDIRAGRKTEVRSICGEIWARLKEPEVAESECFRLLERIESISRV